MLREAALYSRLSNDHIYQASQALARFGHHISSTEGEAVLDIGCGPGDVTRNVILPTLDPSFSILVGVDISKDMIDFAQKKWLEEDRLTFKLLDASEHDQGNIRNSLPLLNFNKIFSFYALHWVSDRRQMAKNLSTLLAADGQAFLVLVVNSGIYEVWDTIALCKKWSSFFKSVKFPLNEYQYMEDPAKEVKTCLEDVGLVVNVCQINHHKNAFTSNTGNDLEKLNKLKSVDPLVSFVPDDLKNEYMSDLLTLSKSMVGEEGAVDYSSLTVICRKPITEPNC